jgi:hypothetical protein
LKDKAESSFSLLCLEKIDQNISTKTSGRFQKNIETFSKKHRDVFKKTSRRFQKNIGTFSKKHWDVFKKTLGRFYKNIMMFSQKHQNVFLQHKAGRNVSMPCDEIINAFHTIMSPLRGLDVFMFLQ